MRCVSDVGLISLPPGLIAIVNCRGFLGCNERAPRPQADAVPGRVAATIRFALHDELRRSH